MTRFPAWVQLTAGAMLLGAMWVSAWADTGPLRHHSFFPLWVGYIVVVDGLLRATSGTSLVTRLRWQFLWLFAVSIPIWWLFEIVNIRLENWHYVVPHRYSWLAYHAEASLAFSTVVPAIFVTSELVRNTLFRGRLIWIRLEPARHTLLSLAFAGLAGIALAQIWPSLFFPLVWIGIFLIVDPLVYLMAGRSIAADVRTGRWDTVAVLFTATLICGFFWEFWNSRSTPKWEYDIHYANWLHIFEMPVLGFGGYLPFGLEVFALTCLFDRVSGLGLLSQTRFDKSDQ